MLKKVYIKTAKINQIKDIVKIHLDSINLGLYAKLGEKFLFRYYLNSYKKSNYLYIAEINNKVVGILELKENEGHLDFIRFEDLVNLAKVILKDPRYLYLLIYRLLTLKKKRPAFYEISNIAVDANLRSVGVGKKLIAQAAFIAREKKLNIYTFTHNKNLAIFYKKKYGAKILNPVNLLIYKSYLCVFKP